MATSLQLSAVVILALIGYISAGCTDCAVNGGEYNSDCEDCICQAMSDGYGCKNLGAHINDAGKLVYGYFGLNEIQWNDCFKFGEDKGFDYKECATRKFCARKCANKYNERFYDLKCTPGDDAGCTKCCKQSALLRINLKGDCLNADGDKFWKKVEQCLDKKTPKPEDGDCACFINKGSLMETEIGNTEGTKRSAQGQCVNLVGLTKKVAGVLYYKFRTLDGVPYWAKASALEVQDEDSKDKCTVAICYKLTKSGVQVLNNDQTEYREGVIYNKPDNFFGTGRIQTLSDGNNYVQFMDYLSGTTDIVRSWIRQDYVGIDFNSNCTGEPTKGKIYGSCYCMENDGNIRIRAILHPEFKFNTTLEAGECRQTPNVYVKRDGPEGTQPNLVALEDPDKGVIYTPDFHGKQATVDKCDGPAATKVCLQWKRRDDLIYSSVYGDGTLEEGTVLVKGETYYATGAVRVFNNENYYEFYYGTIPGNYKLLWARAQRVIVPFSSKCDGKPREIFTKRYCVCFNQDGAKVRQSPVDGPIFELFDSTLDTCYKATSNLYPVGKVQYQEFITENGKLAVAPEGTMRMEPFGSC